MPITFIPESRSIYISSTIYYINLSDTRAAANKVSPYSVDTLIDEIGRVEKNDFYFYLFFSFVIGYVLYVIWCL